ncbi:MAG: hypothetical protein ACR2LS_06200 [Thermomicrobiales bacterium]
MDRLPLDVLVIEYERGERERKLERARLVRAARMERGRGGSPRRWLAGRLLASGLRIAPSDLAREWARAALCERQIRAA